MSERRPRNKDNYDYYEQESYDYPKPEHRRIKKKPKKNSKALPVILIVVAGLVLVFCVYKLFTIMSSYKEANDQYKVIDEAFTNADEENNGQKWVWDFDKMLEICSDAVGYISQEGVLSYPIVQAEDNDKYLRNMINGDYNVAGTIFVDYRYPEALDSRYCVVYGHNMNDNSMFGSLSNYEDEKYYKEHPTFDVFVGPKHYKYYVFSAFTADADGLPYYFDELSDEDFLYLTSNLRAECPYETDPDPIKITDHVITLSTCVDWHNYDYRYVVCLVRGEEIKD